jgi:activating signal cointegrator complex subunit 2
MAPRPTPPLIPTRRNVFDDDDFDRLAIDVESKVSFGKQPDRTADDIIKDRSTAPNKAAILSALAALDPDDDERDDTYDAADVGGTVEPSNQEADAAADRHEETLFRAYQADPALFDRDADTRRGKYRAQLIADTEMSHEAIEAWALMLTRNPQQLRRLQAKYEFSGQQSQLERTSWRAAAADGEDGEAADGSSSSAAARGASNRGRGGRGGRGRGRGRGGNVAGPTGDKETEAARRRKESNKGSRANHNRRDARAKKMARGGFPG